MEKSSLGKLGEVLAANYLKSLGYEILDLNYFNTRGYRIGEIDIITKDKNGQLVFVEVKTRKGSSDQLVPEENINRNKLLKLFKAINYFLSRNNWEGKDWRLDAVSVIFNFNTRKADIRHIKAIHY